MLALLSACSAEAPATSGASRAPDTASSDVVSMGAQAGDTASLQQPSEFIEPNDSLITPDGWGPLRIGMTRAEVVAAAGELPNSVAARSNRTTPRLRLSEGRDVVLRGAAASAISSVLSPRFGQMFSHDETRLERDPMMQQPLSRVS